MLERVTVKDFQSIANAEVEMDKFTVLVGQSSSGKSAFMRAVRDLFRNGFVPSRVRSGKTKAIVSATVDGQQVTATRGKSISSYILDDVTYNKTGKAVPPQIEQLLSVPELSDKDVTFNFQFDKPFLLDESGARIATVLGTLSNVSVLHSAMREANRRRMANEADVRATEKLLESQKAKLAEYDDLDAELEKADELRASLTRYQNLTNELNQLTRIFESISVNREKLKNLSTDEVPEADWSILEQYVLLERAVSRVEKRLTALKKATADLAEARVQMRDFDDSYGILESVCPTCGQRVDLGDKSVTSRFSETAGNESQ